MKKCKFTILSLWMAGVLFCNSMSAFATEKAGGGNVEENIITEFIEVEESYFELSVRPSLDEVLKLFPDTLTVIIEGEKNELSVTWECTDDYEETNYDMYEFTPVWDEDEYVLADSVNRYWGIPCMLVVVPVEMTEEEKAYLEEAREKLDDILAEETVLALVYLCEEYELREEANADSDAIVDLQTGTTVEIKDVAIDGMRNIWYEVSCVLGNDAYTGYIEKNHLAYSNESFKNWEAEYLSAYGMQMVTYGLSYQDIEQFPESYQEDLIKLKRAHPNWVFVRQNTNLNWQSVINAQNSNVRSLIGSSMASAYKGEYYGDGWYYASEAAIKYYMDPRNFLDETAIFQFELLTFNASYHTKSAVQNILDNTFMSGNIPDDSKTYAQAFYEIGSSLGVSPFHLASRVYQEQGKGTSSLISGKYEGYQGYYNYFNVGASGKTTTEIVVSGLEYAKSKNWNTRYKSLSGGASVLSAGYILKKQDTLYLQKFNVDGTYHGLYNHQYMQNVRAPYTESIKTKAAYASAGAIDNEFVFRIPVYNNMPATACPIPTSVSTATPTPTKSPTPTPTPTQSPTASPTQTPTASPTQTPTASPTATPTKSPTASPTASPTEAPTKSPTATPTTSPTATPTKSPTASPTATPTKEPTASPTATPTKEPTASPTATPTASPTEAPTKSPTTSPTATPTKSPTASPTATPTKSPTASPTASPTQTPTASPTASPTATPTASPTEAPTKSPTATPTASPTQAPTKSPTASPTATPTKSPTASPTKAPKATDDNKSQDAQLITILPQPTQEPQTTVKETEKPQETMQQSTETASTAIPEVTPEAEQTGTVAMEMEENTKVYAQTLEKIREDKTEVLLTMSENVAWTIDGSQMMEGPLEDVDFGVTLGESEIPSQKVTELLAEESRYVEMSLAHEGAFGFDAILTIKLEEAKAGEYANLFYYNETTDEFEFMCAVLVNDNHEAVFGFKHASDYVIIISEHTMEERVEVMLEERKQEELQKKAEKMAAIEEREAPTKKPEKALLVIALILIASMIAVSGIYLLISRKK